MINVCAKYRRSLKPQLFAALLFFFNIGYSQITHENDSIKRVSRESYMRFKRFDTLLKIPSSPVTLKDRNLVFLDELKLRASKKVLTKKLYSFVVVRHDVISVNKISGSSELTYKSFSGMKIRKIEIKSLNVFGSSINDPESNRANKIDNILNSTHVNTNERIIRKNLLFSEGDTISPLILSDNERILRQLSYIDDDRIIVVPVSKDQVDIIVLTKDVYSLGGSYSYKGLKKGSVSVFEKNIIGIGHEIGFDVPWDNSKVNSPGFGVHYIADNIWKSFINLNVYFINALGEKTYGVNLSRKLLSATSKYAGGISIRQMYTTTRLDTLPVAAPLKYNLQDYWIARSFLLNKENVTRLIVGARYLNNNVFARPVIQPDSYYPLQRYRILLGSVALSIQKYYKTNLLYSYGRTEDIPYGALFKITAGKEINEFKKRTYLGAEASFGKSSNILGYFYGSGGLATYLNTGRAEQGILSLQVKYFSNLITIGRSRIRNFMSVDFTRGFDRNTDEHLIYSSDNGFSGFRNDSVNGTRRFTVSLETVVFSPVNIYGFRFAFFGFADFSSLGGSNQKYSYGTSLSGIGLGVRFRNDNLVFNTFQLRLGFFPNPPEYSRINYLTISGEQLLRPTNFDSGPPSVIPYR